MKPQHLKAVEAAALIGAARVEGAAPGSQSLRFEPTGLQGGKYAFDIGTAGAVSLLLQTVTLPLCFADGPSRLTLTGGTHVPWSPCYHYLQWQWLPCLAAAGYHVECSLERAGFYPRGGGLLHANIVPSRHLVPLCIAERGRLLRIRGLSGVGRLDRSIAERQRSQAVERLRELGVPLEIEVADVPAASPGTFIVLQAEFEGGRCCAFALGARHKPAEKVADAAGRPVAAATGLCSRPIGAFRLPHQPPPAHQRRTAGLLSARSRRDRWRDRPAREGAPAGRGRPESGMIPG
jgi:RNA 3'-terminal phosphate cyclase (ATP)